MKKVVLIFLVLFYGCTVSKTIIGTYSSSVSPYMFIISPDSSYHFQYKFHFEYAYSIGNLNKVNSNIYRINSHFSNKEIILLPNYSKTNHTNDSLTLSVQTNLKSDESEYYRCLIYLNGGLFSEKRCDSLHTIDIPTNSYTLLLKLTADSRMPSRFLDTLVSLPYALRFGEKNKCTIEMKYLDSFFNYKTFINQPIIIRNNKLRFNSIKLAKVK